MNNRENRRARRSTGRHPVSKTDIGRGNLIAALIFLIPVLLGAGIILHARAAGSTTQAVASTAGDTQSDPSTSDDVPAINQPAAPAPENHAATPPKPKNETYLELDMSQGKGLFTAWRLEPSDEVVVTKKAVETVGELKKGDMIHMSQGLIGLVTKAEKYVDPHPDADNKPDADGNVAERVVGRSMHITDTLLKLRTTDEVVVTTPEHPFYVHGKGWVKAGALQPGSQIETESADKLVTVVSTEVVHKRQAVYNLDVENTHTFYVGNDKLLVHNGDCVPSLSDAKNLLGKWAEDPVTGTRAGSVRYHFDEHGDEVGADDVWDYLQQAKKASQNLKGPGMPIEGQTADVMRYRLSGGRYIDMSPGGIISYGSRYH